MIECVLGDITRQPDLDAIVNAANAHLAPGGGVAGAVHRAAGPGLYEECRRLAPIRTGEAVMTSAHSLPNRFVVHTLGPVYTDSPDPARELASCYTESLARADDAGCVSVGAPAVSTEIFGYPVADAAQIAIRTVSDLMPRLRTVQLVRFVLFGPSDVEAHEAVLRSLRP